MAVKVNFEANMKDKKVVTAMDRLNSKAKRLNNNFKQLRGGVAAAFISGAIAKGVRDVVAMAAHTDNMSKVLGVTAEQFQELEFWAQRGGATLEDMRVSWNGMSKSMERAAAGNEQAIADWEKFGVTVDDIQSKSLFENFKTAAETIRTTEEPMDNFRTALLRTFGEAGAKMMPAFTNSLQEAQDEAREMGAVMSDEVVAQLNETQIQFQEAGRVLKTAFAPVVAFLAKMVNNIIRSFALLVDWIKLVGKTWANVMTGGGMNFTDFKNEAVKVFDKHITSYDKASARAAARIAAAGRPPARKASSGGSLNTPEVEARTGAVSRDSNVAQGNFLFARQSKQIDLLKQQIEALKNIDKNTAEANRSGKLAVVD